jgi:hypothetical protein
MLHAPEMHDQIGVCLMQRQSPEELRYAQDSPPLP